MAKALKECLRQNRSRARGEIKDADPGDEGRIVRVGGGTNKWCGKAAIKIEGIIKMGIDSKFRTFLSICFLKDYLGEKSRVF